MNGQGMRVYIHHRRGAFGVARSDGLGNAKAFRLWNRAPDLAPRFIFICHLETEHKPLSRESRQTFFNNASFYNIQIYRQPTKAFIMNVAFQILLL